MGLKRFLKVETARKRFLRWHDDDCQAWDAHTDEECTCGYLTAVRYLFQKRVKVAA